MSREDYDSPNDVAWYLRDLMEKTDYGVQDYVTSVARTRDGAAFLVKFQTGKRLRVTVTEEPSVRFYPEEGEPDERERKEFGETSRRRKISAPRRRRQKSSALLSERR